MTQFLLVTLKTHLANPRLRETTLILLTFEHWSPSWLFCSISFTWRLNSSSISRPVASAFSSKNWMAEERKSAPLCHSTAADSKEGSYLPYSGQLQDHKRHEATLSPGPSAGLVVSEPLLGCTSASNSLNKNHGWESIISEKGKKKVSLVDWIAWEAEELHRPYGRPQSNLEVNLVITSNHKNIY